jgi:calcineurin-like phosphoesterase family protein
MNWFTSDTHFGHKNVIEYCARPFKDVEEMNEELIRRWNVCVKNTDTVWHLGDFSFLGSIATKAILSRLNGKIILVRGNHDAKPWRFFERVESWQMIVLQDEVVNLCHYPYRGYSHDERDFFTRQLEDKGVPLLHGHVHKEWKIKGRMINVGVDQWDYAPVSEDEIILIIKGFPR